MPRFVDHDARRRQIVEATCQVVAEEGLPGLSFRAVAARLGGSTTVVTHYFGSQRELVEGCVASLVEQWADELTELEQRTANPRERLMLLLESLVPSDEVGRVQERARINLLAGQLLGSELGRLSEVWETNVREAISGHLRAIDPELDTKLRVDLLRVLTNGLTLSAIEHPERWPAEVMLTTLRTAIEGLGLAPEQGSQKLALN
jgi:AcrR family transcriptional regulator